eukprot:520056-Alexandrium_andersonii.AAC.1
MCIRDSSSGGGRAPHPQPPLGGRFVFVGSRMCYVVFRRSAAAAAEADGQNGRRLGATTPNASFNKFYEKEIVELFRE